MGKWMNNILDTQNTRPIRDHPPVKDLAHLADGGMPEADREICIRHLNRCEECLDLFDAILTHVRAHQQTRPISRFPYAVPASIIFFVLIGGTLVYHHYFRQPAVLTAFVTLDQEFRNVLMENEKSRWENEKRVARLAALLRDRGGESPVPERSAAGFCPLSIKKPVRPRGVKVSPLKGVLLASVHYPSKSLFGPEG